jgi:hypothetical protein
VEEGLYFGKRRFPGPERKGNSLTGKIPESAWMGENGSVIMARTDRCEFR